MIWTNVCSRTHVNKSFILSTWRNLLISISCWCVVGGSIMLLIVKLFKNCEIPNFISHVMSCHILIHLICLKFLTFLFKFWLPSYIFYFFMENYSVIASISDLFYQKKSRNMEVAKIYFRWNDWLVSWLPYWNIQYTKILNAIYVIWFYKSDFYENFIAICNAKSSKVIVITVATYCSITTLWQPLKIML